MPGWTLLCALAIGSHDSLQDRATAAAIGAPAVVACILLTPTIQDARFTGVVERVDRRQLVVRGIFSHPFLKLESNETRTFKPSASLEQGMIDKDRPGYNHSYSYRLCDIETGDHIELRFNQFDTTNTVFAICIQKRPGGRVPPCPDTEGDKLQEKRFGFKWHEWRNAYWDLEEKGIPYPAHFGEHRRWPVAPPPRPVIRR